MKKLLFINGLLAVAVILSYCTKPSIQEEQSVNQQEPVVADRVLCALNINPSNPTTLTFCGTNTNPTTCVQCGAGATSTGVTVLTGPGVVNIQAPASFSITSTMATSLNINGNPPIPMAIGQCRKFLLDGNCNLTLVK